jgi:hypothetical protein
VSKQQEDLRFFWNSNLEKGSAPYIGRIVAGCSSMRIAIYRFIEKSDID